MKAFNIVRKYGSKAAVAASGLAASVASFAQTAPTTVFDPTTYVDQITGTIPGMLLIGGAVFAVVLAIKSTKWGRRAL